MNAVSETSKARSLDVLILSLPAELRNEIYSYLLPYPLPDLIIKARYVRLRWMCASQRLFNDVAPHFYNHSCFSTYLKLDPSDMRPATFVGDFCDHLRLTYGQCAPSWVFDDAIKLIRVVSVDIAAPDLVKLLGTPDFPFDGWNSMLSRFKEYFNDVATVFSKIEKVRICFQNQLTHQQRCPSLQLRVELLEIVDGFKQTLPIDVLHSANQNYNALSPLVLLPLETPGSETAGATRSVF